MEPEKFKSFKRKSDHFSYNANQNCLKKVYNGGKDGMLKYYCLLKDDISVDLDSCIIEGEVRAQHHDEDAWIFSSCLESISNKRSWLKGENHVCEFTSSDFLTANSTTAKVSKFANNENYNKNEKQSNKRARAKLATKNRRLTEFFQIRRSSRKTFDSLQKERLRVVEGAIISGKEEGFQVREFPCKGRGVISVKPIKRGEFVLEYFGELIDIEQAKKRENMYSFNEDTGCYMYYFQHNNKRYCIDATKETGRFGRLINHSKSGNLKTQIFLVQDCPHLVFLACKDIKEGDELLYDYGDRSKLSLESHPWLAL